MVSQMPVRSCITSTNMDSTPNRYQKLKFFGAQYFTMW